MTPMPMSWLTSSCHSSVMYSLNGTVWACARAGGGQGRSRMRNRIAIEAGLSRFIVRLLEKGNLRTHSEQGAWGGFLSRVPTGGSTARGDLMCASERKLEPASYRRMKSVTLS